MLTVHTAALHRAAVLVTLVALVASLLVAVAPPASAATFTVDSGHMTGNAGVDDPPVGPCDPGDCSLREAVAAANATPEPDTITFEAEQTVALGLTGPEDPLTNDVDVTAPLTIEGQGVTVFGHSLASPVTDDSRLFDAVDTDLTLRGLQLGVGVTYGGGGIVRATGGSLTLDAVLITSGGSYDDGGAVFVSEGSLTVLDSIFLNNTTARDGGAIATDEHTHLQVTGSVFFLNIAGADPSDEDQDSGSPGGDGGAIYASGLGGPGPASVVDNSLFIQNAADRSGTALAFGGAIHFRRGFLEVSRSWFQENGLVRLTRGDAQRTWRTDYGGAISSESTVALVDTVIYRNQAQVVGGGLNLSGPTTIDRSAIVGNQTTASNGKGGGLAQWVTADATIRNTTVHRNTAAQAGSGIWLVNPAVLLAHAYSQPARVHLQHLTITGNEGPSALDVAAAVAARIGNSVLAEHAGASCIVNGQLSSGGYNLEDADTCGLDQPNDLTETAAVLAPLADNGGLDIGGTQTLARVSPTPLTLHTFTRLPGPGSPAQDSADPASCGTTPVEVDQRQVSRPQGPACDRGAAETGVQTPDPQPTPEDEVDIPDVDPDPPPGTDPDPGPNPDPEPDPDPEENPLDTGCNASSGDVSEPAIGQGVTRVEGLNRIQTAIAASKVICGDGQAPAVVLTRADLFPDAQAGTPLAVQHGAPLLLSGPDTLDAETEVELQRILIPGRTVYLLGGAAALSQAVEQRLVDLGYTTVRYGGVNRFDTAAIIAGDGLDDPSTLLIANGGDFADAVIAGAAATTYRTSAKDVGAAVILTSGTNQAPESTTYLASRSDSPELIAIGGAAGTAHPGIETIDGPTRFDTSVAAAERFFSAPATVGIARGDDFPDALTGGAIVGRPEIGPGPILLTETTTLPESVVDWLVANAGSIQRTVLFGGTQAISGEVEAAIIQAAADPDPTAPDSG